MIRKVIKIDQEKCDGCGLCATACHEGAIGIIDNKAVLLRDDYCDGLGDCLPVCPTGAISFEEREALPFDKAAVLANMTKKQASVAETPCGCPGSATQAFKKETPSQTNTIPSQLAQWPVQIQLVPVNAPYFADADLLIAADCVSYAYGSFHNEFMSDKITIIGCPKLDATDYSEKLTAILKSNMIKSVTVVRMEVPCCGGIEASAKIALMNSGKQIPCRIVTISTDGRVLSES